MSRLLWAGVVTLVSCCAAVGMAPQVQAGTGGARDDGRALFDHLNADGVVVDWREPDIIRVAPVPLYNRYVDCARLIASVVAWREAHHAG